MKIKNPIVIAALSVVGVITFALVYPLTMRNSKYRTITIEGTSYDVKVATNEAQWARGLMFVEGRQDYDGMLFEFPQKSVRTFWNMNTYSDLEVVWMNDDRVIGRSELPSIKRSKELRTVTSPGPVNRVVELLKK